MKVVKKENYTIMDQKYIIIKHQLTVYRKVVKKEKYTIMDQKYIITFRTVIPYNIHVHIIMSYQQALSQ